MFNTKKVRCIVCEEHTGKKEIETFFDSILTKSRNDYAFCDKCISNLYREDVLMREGFVYEIDFKYITSEKEIVDNWPASSRITIGHVVQNDKGERVLRYVRPIVVDGSLYKELRKVGNEVTKGEERVDPPLENRVTFSMDEFVLSKDLPFSTSTPMNKLYDLQTIDAVCCLLYIAYKSSHMLEVIPERIISRDMFIFKGSTLALGDMGRPIKKQRGKESPAKMSMSFIEGLIREKQKTRKEHVGVKLINGVLEKENNTETYANNDEQVLYCSSCNREYSLHASLKESDSIKRCPMCGKPLFLSVLCSEESVLCSEERKNFQMTVGHKMIHNETGQGGIGEYITDPSQIVDMMLDKQNTNPCGDTVDLNDMSYVDYVVGGSTGPRAVNISSDPSGGSGRRGVTTYSSSYSSSNSGGITKTINW